jgi:PKD domain-containing protein
MLSRVMRRLLIVGVALAGIGAGATVLPSPASASPGWSVPADYALPAKALSPQIGYQVGGGATVAYLEIVSLAPLQTALHIGVIPPGGSYQEQLSIPSSTNSIPIDVKFAEASDGAAVLQWTVLQGSEPKSSPLAYLASYRQPRSVTWEAPSTIATDATQTEGIATTLVPAISLDGTAAAGVEHLDATLPPPGGHRIDVAVHPVGGVWGSAVQISPSKDSSEGLALGFDAHGNLTAAFRKELTAERHTLDALRRPASSGVWGSLEDVTGSEITSDAGRPELGVAPDGSAAIAFQYVHYTGSKTLDVNAVTRSGATGPWTAPVDVALGGASSGPMAVGVSPEDKANVLYRFQGQSSAESCVGVVRAFAGGNFFSAPQCVSPPNFEPGAAGGVAFLGNDAYFAWSGEPNGEKVDVVQGSRWLGSASQSDSFTNLDAPIESAGLNQLLPDEDGSVAAFWTTRVETAPSQYETKLRAAAFDAGGPNLLGAAVPMGAVAGQPVAMSASFVDLWSGLGEAPSWSFGDGASASGAQVSHAYAAPGVYTVTVTARDGLGNTTNSTYSITVNPGAPFSPPLPVSTLKLIGAKVVGQSVVLQLACTGAPCKGEAKLTTREKLISGKLVAVQSRHGKARTTYKKVTVGVSHFTLSQGRTLTVAVALNSTGRGLLARFRKLPVSLTIAASPTIPARHFTILPPKHSAKHRKH